MTSPADELRAAAKLLRETASKATGYTTPWHIEPGFNTEWLVGTPAQHLVASGTKPIAEWVALMSPDKAEFLADWLDAEADSWPTSPAHTSTEPTARRRRAALAFARKVNGGQQS